MGLLFICEYSDYSIPVSFCVYVCVDRKRMWDGLLAKKQEDTPCKSGLIRIWI